jgi:hypothetical protein
MAVSQYDEEKITSFAGFVAALGGVRVVLVASSDEKDIAKYVVEIMVKEGTKDELLVEETYWEQVLRAAGINAFASQVLLRVGGIKGVLEGGREGERRIKEVLGEKVGRWVIGRIGSAWGEQKCALPKTVW